MKKYLVSLLVVLATSACGTARAQEADVALVNLLSGDVTYAPRAGTPGKLQPFMKIRDGDRIDLTAGSRVRIVFFDGARQELWTGPASFRAGKAAAEAISGKAAQTMKLPADVPQRLARVPELVRLAAIGGARVRGIAPREPRGGPEQQATLDRARAAYATMRRDLPADDIAPELYLYAALYELRRYDEMKPVVAEMLRKQPDSQDARALDTWVASRTGR